MTSAGISEKELSNADIPEELSNDATQKQVLNIDVSRKQKSDNRIKEDAHIGKSTDEDPTKIEHKDKGTSDVKVAATPEACLMLKIT